MHSSTISPLEMQSLHVVREDTLANNSHKQITVAESKPLVVSVQLQVGDIFPFCVQHPASNQCCPCDNPSTDMEFCDNCPNVCSNMQQEVDRHESSSSGSRNVLSPTTSDQDQMISAEEQSSDKDSSSLSEGSPKIDLSLAGISPLAVYRG